MTTLYENQAKDKKIVEEVQEKLLPALTRIRNERRYLDQSFMRYYNVWSATRDMQSYNGRSKTYLTIGRRIIENWVQKVKRDLLATDEWFDVVALRESFEQRVPPIKALFKYYLTKQMRFRRKLTPFLRQMVTLGTSPVSIVWRADERALPVLKDILDADGNPTGKQVEKLEKVLQYIGPTFRIADLFAWRISPVTVTDVRDATHVMEDMLVDQLRIKQLSKTPLDPNNPKLGNVLENVDDALENVGSGDSGMNSDKFAKERERLMEKGFSGRVEPNSKSRPLDVTAVYWRTVLDDKLDWYRVTILGERTIGLVQRNPWWHGQPPWLAGKFVEVENEFYGRSVCESFDRLQYFLNDVSDQASDALVWCMNPIAIVDGYRVQDPTSLRMRPGVKWLAEPDAVKFTEPPKETPAVGFSAVSQITAFMNDVANVSAFSAVGSSGPRNRGKGLDTATGVNTVANENLVQVRDVVENTEDQVLVPMLTMMHSLTMQCLSAPIILRITGADGLSLVEQKVSAQDVVGDYQFDWLGSTGTQNQQVRAMQMINYLQIAAQIPPQLLQQQNAQIDFAYLLRQIWSEGMGLRNGNRVVRDLTPLKSVDPRLENDLFFAERGDEVKVSPADNDVQHMKQHETAVNDSRLPDSQKMLLMQHIQEHHASFLTKQVMQAMQAQGQLAGPGGPPTADQPTQPGAPAANGAAPSTNMPLNPGRMASTTSPDDVFRALGRQ